jgi:hypothetical protein
VGEHIERGGGGGAPASVGAFPHAKQMVYLTRGRFPASVGDSLSD